MVNVRLLRATVAAVALIGLVTACKTNGPAAGGDLGQGWDATYQGAWYNGGQGSRLMPLSWFKVLEQPDATGPFYNDTYLATFRVLPAKAGSGQLPVGFAVDEHDDTGLIKTQLRWMAGQGPKEKWVGLNCAACHTAEVTYAGKSLRIDGAPGLFDFQSFVEAVDKALVQTRDAAGAADKGRWDRFAKGVLGTNDNTANRALLLASLNKLIDWEAKTDALNHPSGAPDMRYGFARVDAVGHIFNRILLFGGATQINPFPNASDAPVSYPHLWNITKQTQLQWDGIAQNSKVQNFDYGALGRNTGEVLGVFGEVIIKPPSGVPGGQLGGLASTADVVNLNRMELQLAALRPPVWPEPMFGKPGDGVVDAGGAAVPADKALTEGKGLFDQHCAGCHTARDGHYETMVTFAHMGDANRSDEWMACNTWDFQGRGGALTGTPENYLNGRPLNATEPVANLLTTSVKGALVGQKYGIIYTAAQTFAGITPPPTVGAQALKTRAQQKAERLARCLAAADNPLMAYKARPLEGIWATAPYLHNGSVPTLYDLLLAPAQRPATFRLGTRAYDPKKAGYVTDAAADGNSFTFDTSVPGNANKGHDYGVGTLTETQRQELLAYLKSL